MMVMKATLLLDWFPIHLWIEHPDITLDMIFTELLTAHVCSKAADINFWVLCVSRLQMAVQRFSLLNAFTSLVEQTRDVISSGVAGVYFRHWPWHVPVSHRSRKRCISLRDWAGSFNGKIDIGSPVIVGGWETVNHPFSMKVHAKKG